MSKTPDPTAEIEHDTNTREFLADPHVRQHTDADALRRLYGRAEYNRESYREYKRHVYPGMLEHHWSGPPEGATRAQGGTDCLATGEPGSGKSTWNLHLAMRLMEINEEIVVWRGSTARSEWLPFAPITRVALPAGVDVDATLVPKDPREEYVEDVAMSDIAREVVRYDSPQHLNRELLEPGMFHVVYPDPEMAGCQRVYQASGEKQYDPPAGRETLFGPEDPANHWWFAWVLDRVENGPNHWTSVILDEIGDIAPQTARKDSFGTYQKVELLRDSFADARKFGLSLFASGHNEGDIHSKVRKKMRWRVQMPGGANPTRAGQVAGFESVPMDRTMTQDWSLGTLLVYNERHFDKIKIGPIESPISHELKLSMGESA
jgi:hypothetical protein